jgi:hypothetical protein
VEICRLGADSSPSVTITGTPDFDVEAMAQSTNNDLSVGTSAANSNNLGMLTQTGEIAIEQSNVNLNSYIFSDNNRYASP